MIARYEMKRAFRSRWLLLLFLLFVSLAFISIFMTNATSTAQYDGFTRQMASLLNVSLFILPLMTILIGSMLVAGEKEDGQLLLYRTYPVSPTALVIGKWLGLFLPLAVMLTLGYGIALLVLSFLMPVRLGLAVAFYLIALLLITLFLSFSLWVGYRVKSRLHAIGVSLFSWAFFVLFYEFLIIALTFLLPATQIVMVLTVSVFFNPVEIVRVGSILALESGTFFGPSMYDFTIWATSLFGIIAFVIASLAWILVPLLDSIRLVKKGNHL